MFKLKFLDAEHGNLFIYLFNLSVAGWHQIHLQPLYVKSLPENSSINFYWDSVLVSKFTHFPHTTTWEKFAAIGEEHTHRKTWKVTLCWRIKGNLLCWYIPQVVNNEHNSFTRLVSQTHLFSHEEKPCKNCTTTYYMHSSQTTHVPHVFLAAVCH